jgi:arylsulfatase A-like enzyme
MAALWLLCCAAVAFAAVAAAKQPAAVERSKRPNIVFVLLDDVRYDDVVDHPFVRLPNIEKLAAEGASFTNFFTSAPLCSPSRAVFLTGKYPRTRDVPAPAARGRLSNGLLRQVAHGP